MAEKCLDLSNYMHACHVSFFVRECVFFSAMSVWRWAQLLIIRVIYTRKNKTRLT